jgi:hypothetical protein
LVTQAIGLCVSRIRFPGRQPVLTEQLVERYDDLSRARRDDSALQFARLSQQTFQSQGYCGSLTASIFGTRTPLRSLAPRNLYCY